MLLLRASAQPVVSFADAAELCLRTTDDRRVVDLARSRVKQTSYICVVEPQTDCADCALYSYLSTDRGVKVCVE